MHRHHQQVTCGGEGLDGVAGQGAGMNQLVPLRSPQLPALASKRVRLIAIETANRFSRRLKVKRPATYLRKLKVELFRLMPRTLASEIDDAMRTALGESSPAAPECLLRV